MCEDDKYEQEKFQQFNQYFNENISTDEQEIDLETDSDPDEILVTKHKQRIGPIHCFSFRKILMRRIYLQQRVGNRKIPNFGH